MLPQFYKGKNSIFISVLNPSSRPCQEIHAVTFTRCVKFLFTKLVFQSLKEQKHTSFPFISLKITVFGLLSLLQKEQWAQEHDNTSLPKQLILLMSSANTTAITCWFLLAIQKKLLINDKMKVSSFLAPLRTQKTKFQVSANLIQSLPIQTQDFLLNPLIFRSGFWLSKTVSLTQNCAKNPEYKSKNVWI